MKNTVFILVLSILFFGSCQRDVYFNDFEKSLLDIYNEGDTLIFESDRGIRDTSYILKKDIGYADWNPFAHSGKYRFLSGDVYYSRGGLINSELNSMEHFSLSKRHPDTTWFFIAHSKIVMFEKFSKLSEQSLAQFKVDTNLYRFRITRVEKDKGTEALLYWHLKYGLVKFVTPEGEVWSRINFERR